MKSAPALPPPFTLRALTLGVAACCAALSPAAFAQAQSAAVQQGVKRFAIAGGPLAEVINRYAVAAGVTITFDASLLSGLNSPGLEGSYSVQEGFSRLLSGMGMEAVVVQEGRYVLRAIPAAARPTTQLGEVRVSAAAERSALTENSGSYTVQRVGAGTKMDESLRELPRSISVMTRQQMDDQHITMLEDAMGQLPGVTVLPGTTGYSATQYYARGFQITSIMVDGSPSATWHSNDTSSNTGMAKYDSVQLLRGPDGMLSGAGQPSGSINLIRKRPLDHFQFKTALSAGRWNNYLGEVDVSGPLVESGHVRGRLVASHNDREYFFDNAHRYMSTLYGIVEVDLGERTLLSVGASHDLDKGSGRETAPHLPRYSTGQTLPVSRSQGYTDWSFKDSESTNVFTTLEHRFNNDWKGRVSVSHTETSLKTNVSSYNGAVDPLTGQGSYLYEGTWAEGDFRSTAVDVTLTGAFELLGRHHQIAVGADHRDAKFDVPLYSGTAGSAWITDWSNLDPDLLLPDNNRGAAGWVIASENKQTGFYATGKFQLHGPLSVVLGGRYSRFEARSSAGDSSASRPSVTTNRNNDTFTPYYALVYDFADNWTGFVTMAESFEDQSNYYDAAHNPLDPTTGRSYEAGIKGEFFGGRLNTSMVLYRAERENYAVRLFTEAGFDVPGRACCYSGDGKHLSRGVEFDISGELTPDWQINAGYTYDDNKTEYGSSDGERYASYTPKHIFRLWSRYRLPAALAQWSVGGGVKAQTSYFRSGTVNTWNPTGGTSGTGAYDGSTVPFQFTESGRAIWNAFVEYKVNRQWTAALNINNLFDKKYYSAVGTTASGNIYGEPRNVLLTLRGTY